MIKISKGENILIRRNLFQADGTDLPVASLSVAKVTLRQAKQTPVTYVRGTDPELRNGTLANQIELEITKTMSSAFVTGDVTAEWEFEISNVEFAVDGVNNQQFIESICHVLPY